LSLRGLAEKEPAWQVRDHALTDQDRRVQLLGHAFNAACHVDGVADHRNLTLSGVADPTEDNCAKMDADVE
jgi:hypothetical protein